MKHKAIWAFAMSSALFASCSTFNRMPASSEEKPPPSVAGGSGHGVKPDSIAPVKIADKPDSVTHSTSSPAVTVPKTPEEFFRQWIRQDGNKAVLQAWLNQKPSASKDMDVFLADKRYRDLRYEAYFDLVGSK